MIRAARLSLPALWLAITLAVADDTVLLPDQIFAGEIAELIIDTDHRIATLPAIDTSPLTRDFRVIDLSSRVTRMLDARGRSIHRAQWRIQIAPRRLGRLQVPALDVGDRRSKPLVLEVKPATAQAAGPEVSIEVETRPTDPYRDQEIRVTTRVYHGSAFEWARLTEPKSDHVARYQHGGDRRYRVERDGREYLVLERTQSLFPRRSGRLSLGEAEFRGRSGERSGLGGRWLYRFSDPLELRVREPPVAAVDSPWLPARRVELALEWTPPAQPPEPGEPVDFTLAITAEGLAAEFLPAGLLAGAGDGFKLFADRAVREDLLTDDVLVGRLVQPYALVATRAGEIQLPGVVLDWWDTASDSPRRAVVAPTRLEIAAPRVAPAPPQRPAAWRRYAIPALGGLLAMAAWLAWRGAARTRPFESWLARRRCRNRLRRACRDQDARAARRALATWPGGVPLDPASTAMRDLDAALYARQARPWNGAAFWQAFTTRRHHDRRGGAGHPGLPALYPRGN